MLRGIVKTMRPHQWVKNVFVLAPVIFAQELFDTGKVVRALLGLLFFSLLTSAVYVLNDLVDVEADRAHPVKKNRPIASGVVTVSVARVAAVVLAIVALSGGYFLGWFFLASLAGYLTNNIAYTFGLKRVAYLDVLSIAMGFELRVLAGSYAAEVPPSHYLLIVTFLLAAFLGLGKRMHELVQQEASGSSNSRKVLERYNKGLVNILLWVTGAATCVTYAIYTLDPHTRAAFGTDLLAVTTIFAVVGILRFIHLVRNRPEAESPTEEMLRDKPFLLTGVLGVLTTIGIIYFGH
ncbi:MAG: decaprenyl-phosphate phosphoribosyltransferase [Sandaracinaceae bacterium]